MTSTPSYQCLRLILGDQLNPRHSWFREKCPNTLYVIAELRQEIDYVKHHVQKVCAFFAAMQRFADALEQAGHQVKHFTLDDTQSFDDLPHFLTTLANRYQISTLQYQLPDEWRVRQQLKNHQWPTSLTVNAFDTEHYYLGEEELERWIKPNQHNRMETFYRKMRKRFDVLMEGHQPCGGQWNYDQQNRQSLSADNLRELPAPHIFDNDVTPILERIDHHNVAVFGTSEAKLPWPVTRRQSLYLLREFCDKCLPHFGQFQDAMTAQSEHSWSLYHSRLSFSLNSKMISPAEVIAYALEAFADNDDIDLAQIEGFVRQILGWREYVRAVYQMNMPRYQERNQLRAQRALPEWFWTAQTHMNCQKQVIEQSLQRAYAHHIQRLMITGNFCLLAGIHPDHVDAWYLGIYVDALQWVELPNTRGMSQFADGGIVATKPYAAGANYVNKMSDYCDGCHYNPKHKSEDDACPLNSLYWGFLHRHRKQLKGNQRLSMIYGNWDRMSEEKRHAILKRHDWCLDHLEEL